MGAPAGGRGVRTGSEVVVVVDARQCMEDHIVFYRSSNGVILSEGVHGIIGPQYIRFAQLTDLRRREDRIVAWGPSNRLDTSMGSDEGVPTQIITRPCENGESPVSTGGVIARAPIDTLPEWNGFSDTEDAEITADYPENDADNPLTSITADYPFPTTANLSEMEGLNPFSADDNGDTSGGADDDGEDPDLGQSRTKNARREKVEVKEEEAEPISATYKADRKNRSAKTPPRDLSATANVGSAGSEHNAKLVTNEGVGRDLERPKIPDRQDKERTRQRNRAGSS